MNTELIALVITNLLSPALTWFLARRKFKVEAKMSELESIEKAIAIWRGLAKDMEQEVKNLRGEIVVLRETNTKLNEEMQDLKIQLDRIQSLPKSHINGKEK